MSLSVSSYAFEGSVIIMSGDLDKGWGRRVVVTLTPTQARALLEDIRQTIELAEIPPHVDYPGGGW